MSIESLINNRVRLPSPPAIAVKILDAVHQDTTSMQQLAEIISSDPALAARLLRVANSSIYGLSYRVGSIEKALTVLGVNVLKNIALSFVISEELRSGESEGFDLDYFWRRAVTAAVAADLTAKMVGQANEDAFVTALLADIGVLLLQRHDPHGYQALLDEHQLRKCSISEVEKEKLGFDHAELSATLLARWGLPRDVCEPLLYHHRPADAPEKHYEAAEVVQLADRLSSIYHAPGGTGQFAQLTTLMTSRFGLSAPAVEMLVDSVAEKSVEVFASFDLEPGDMRPYSEMLQDANEELGKMGLSSEQLLVEVRQTSQKNERLAAELRQANSKLRELVFRDGLTGLYNHRYFQEMVDHEMERVIRFGSCFSLLMFDLDYFKRINDRYGHPVGDLVLKNIADTVSSGVRSSDIVARYGGEEFAAILPGADPTGLKVFAERLRRRVETLRTEVGEDSIQVTISIGGTTYQPGVAKVDKFGVIDTADRALYQSKALGRNRVTIFPLEGGRLQSREDRHVED